MLNDQRDKLCNNSKSSLSNQPTPNPDHDRTGQPVVGTDRSGQPVVETRASQTRSSHESTSFNVEDETIHDRTVQPVVNRDESGHEQTMLNEVNIGLPNSRHILL